MYMHLLGASSFFGKKHDLALKIIKMLKICHPEIFNIFSVHYLVVVRVVVAFDQSRQQHSLQP